MRSFLFAPKWRDAGSPAPHRQSNREMLFDDGMVSWLQTVEIVYIVSQVTVLGAGAQANDGAALAFARSRPSLNVIAAVERYHKSRSFHRIALFSYFYSHPPLPGTSVPLCISSRSLGAPAMVSNV